MTLLFVASVAGVLVHGFVAPVGSHGHARVTGPEGSAVVAVLLSFPVAMALATGTEAPAAAIGQLGQLRATDRRRFARATIVLTMAIVTALTIGITALAVRLRMEPARRLDPDRRYRPRCCRQRRTVCAVSGQQRAVAALGRKLVLPGRTRTAQGALAAPRQVRRYLQACGRRPRAQLAARGFGDRGCGIYVTSAYSGTVY